ncbi:UDP-N-acetylmuramoylalanine--D-glutamate ligase [Lacrimispora xylanisolvens]|jgi:UDP-N-acetylmuramoylalanine--D-glutamate ligase|uniref:UDP-N-acetylmuramoylalanine--D-glutamate ligase n=1 Tax=Lacrimispora xylanisolvens TaxID=384636 RepID=A0A2S6HP49_9FIRM|nr:UDP-N-acetylmuramoyl-L-alanine--D-glutamate ligase [Hungatella xylanolytica]MBE5986770.1 UDP-N-acetylmuramoyl-L-alanine--D-glutamate ligase [Paenibacillaceae bacterium]PPK79155.1 UDP-N-acetylmuramoylalanine--D-glutamate ligase [Hungatella xylanolytica]
MSQKILVAGSGKSGIAASRMILKTGDEAVLYDSNDALKKDELLSQFGETDKISVILGELKKEDLNDISICVISPGIGLDAPFVSVLKEENIPIWSEIQLAYHHAKGKLAAITGTNGKTTTTALTGEIMKAYYEHVYVVGNIGIPYTQEALKTTEDSVTVAEVSSFQLETITDFHPDVSAILNITPDHLNRHKTMECYIKVKESITVNQTEKDCCVLNYDDLVLREFGESMKPRAVYFSSRNSLDEGYCIDGDVIIRNHGGNREEIVNINELNLLGRHNHENVMAAIAIASELNVPIDVIKKAVCEFQAVEHRIEFVAEKAGVKYYNDSKGTNPDAAIQAVKAMPGPTILIAGGYDKNSEYDEWIESFDGKVKHMVLLGQTREKIAECAAKHGFTNVMYAEDMQEAVKVCASYANKGDYVLLSPACASWGMFRCYEERGEIFKECVRSL